MAASHPLIVDCAMCYGRRLPFLGKSGTPRMESKMTFFFSSTVDIVAANKTMKITVEAVAADL